MLGSYPKEPQLLYHGKFVLHVSVSVSCLALSVTVRSCHAFVVHLSSLRFEFLSRRPLRYGSNPLLLNSSAHHLLSARAVFPDSNVRNSLRRSIINLNRFPWNFHFNYIPRFSLIQCGCYLGKKVKMIHLKRHRLKFRAITVIHYSMRKEQTHGYKFLVSKINAVTRWTNCESLGEHPMWMFYISGVARSLAGIGRASAVC